MPDGLSLEHATLAEPLHTLVRCTCSSLAYRGRHLVPVTWLRFHRIGYSPAAKRARCAHRHRGGTVAQRRELLPRWRRHRRRPGRIQDPDRAVEHDGGRGADRRRGDPDRLRMQRVAGLAHAQSADLLRCRRSRPGRGITVRGGSSRRSSPDRHQLATAHHEAYEIVLRRSPTRSTRVRSSPASRIGLSDSQHSEVLLAIPRSTSRSCALPGREGDRDARS